MENNGEINTKRVTSQEKTGKEHPRDLRTSWIVPGGPENPDNPFTKIQRQLSEGKEMKMKKPSSLISIVLALAMALYPFA